MGRLIYSAIASLDGYVEDADGKFGWAAPDAEVHGFINDLERPVGTYIYGRKMYETMVFWQTAGLDDDEPAVFRDYAEIWRAADKVVVSRALASVSTPRTSLETGLGPDWVGDLKRRSEADLGIGGAELGGQALRLGLVDEIQLTLCPVIVGGGKRALPDGAHAPLELLDNRRFAGGFTWQRYRVIG